MSAHKRHGVAPLSISTSKKYMPASESTFMTILGDNHASRVSVNIFDACHRLQVVLTQYYLCIYCIHCGVYMMHHVH